MSRSRLMVGPDAGMVVSMVLVGEGVRVRFEVI